MKTNGLALRLGNVKTWPVRSNIYTSFNQYSLQLLQLAYSTEYRNLFSQLNTLVNSIWIKFYPRRITICIRLYSERLNLKIKKKKNYLILFFLLEKVFQKNFMLTNNCSLLQIRTRVQVLKRNDRRLQPQLLVDYILYKLAHQFQVQQIIRQLLRLPVVSGLHIICRGRFDRKERASAHTFHKGSVPLSTFYSRINFSSGSVVLKYGVCGIKIWLKTRKYKKKKKRK